ncbi:unnamed protein product [Arctia plantaginis]|uniref:GH18 domain-containing protein n=1 Tax=Arctia plantaginis TaxID=874455 RepID=A0A8S1AU76_ARCPL|nr:unnamed protein product [Arctia plantaginis]
MCYKTRECNLRVLKTVYVVLLAMWGKMKKEEINNKFKRLKESESILIVNVGTKLKCTTVKKPIPVIWRLGIVTTCLLFIFIMITYMTGLGPLNSIPHKSLWRTSAHINVYTYTHLASMAIQHIASDQLETQPDRVVSCYYNLPSESEAKQLLPSNIDPHLCTHINIGFARIVNKQITLDDYQYKTIRNVVKLKQKNPGLKILLSVGGSGNDNGFSDMVVNHASRKIFIKSIKSILRNYSLDGIDLDWEFPAVHREKIGARERQHFSQLLREIRMEYYREKRNYILTIAAAAPEAIVNLAYDIDQVNQYVDFVNIMTYDYHFYNKYTPFTGLNSPLYPRSSEQMYLATLNVNYTVHMYLDKGLDRSKIVVGIPTYGHTFSLVNANNPRVGSPASGFGSLSTSGFINYPDVCVLVQNFTDVSVVQDNEAKVPYMYRNTDWVSYDTPQSVVEKANFIRENNLRGAMIYSLNADDYAGFCDTGVGRTAEFPLAESVKHALIFNNSEPSERVNKSTE